MGWLKSRSRTVRGDKGSAGLINGCALAARVGTAQPLDPAASGIPR